MDASSDSPSKTSRSHSTEGVAASFFGRKRSKRIDDDRPRRHTADSSDRRIMRQLMSISGIPQRTTSPNDRSDKKSSDVARPSITGSPKWTIFTKTSSNSSLSRRNSEGKSRNAGNEFEFGNEKTISSIADMEKWSGAGCKRITENVESSVSEWKQPGRKLTSNRSEAKSDRNFDNERKKLRDSPRGTGRSDEEKNKTGKEGSKTASNDRSQRLSQRMRDLYDFKTDNEWSLQRNLSDSSRPGSVWTSKSSSEEEKPTRQRNDSSNLQDPPYERLGLRRNSQDLEFNDRSGIEARANADHHRDASNVISNNPLLKMERTNQKPRARIKSHEEQTESPRISVLPQRRTYSDDRDVREVATRGGAKDPDDGNLRTSGAIHSNIGTSNRSSLETSSKSIEISASRALGKRQDPQDPAVVPDASILTSASSSPAAKNLVKSIHERQKRNSTRYKVYLT